MSRSTWHISETDDALTLARRLPARFDVAATVLLTGGAGLSKARIAHQVRQDMWRAVQNLRGFAPVVRVRDQGADLEITAGGTVAGRFPKQATEARIAEVLSRKDHQIRWARHATSRAREEA